MQQQLQRLQLVVVVRRCSDTPWVYTASLPEFLSNDFVGFYEFPNASVDANRLSFGEI